MIELRGLRTGYGGREVLHGVSLTFSPGRVHVLLGPNGCGKSTLLRAALGLQPRTGGEILVGGAPIDALSAGELARRVAYLPQSRAVPNITARRMVLHGRFPYLSWPRKYRQEDYAAAEKALRRADASELAGVPVPSLSGGQRQKVYLAMALAQDAPAILMDEPTAFLDVRCQLEVMSTARRLAAEGKAVVMVLHDLSLALRAADRAAVLSEGELLREGSPEEVYASGALDRAFGVKLRRVEAGSGYHYYCEEEA